MEPWDDARMTAFAALLNPLLIGQRIAADARILELDKLVDKLYCRIFILEVTKRKLVVQLTANAELEGAAREE